MRKRMKFKFLSIILLILAFQIFVLISISAQDNSKKLTPKELIKASHDLFDQGLTARQKHITIEAQN